MKNKTKYIFISIEVRNGEYEYTSQTTHEIPARASVEKFGQQHAKMFYGNKPKPFQYNNKIDPNDWWYFNGGEVAARCNTCEEITKEEFDVLNKFLWK